MPKYDTNEPILVLVRRGRKGRGFTVAPVEDASNPAMCQDKEELGEVIEEMLLDENQPRVNINELLSAAGAPSDSEDPEDDEEEDGYEDEDEDEDEPQGQGGILDGVAGAEDPADRLLFNIFSAAVTKGQQLSSKPRKKPRARARRSSGRRKAK